VKWITGEQLIFYRQNIACHFFLAMPQWDIATEALKHRNEAG
jgi:hypothetical protein